MTVLNIQGYSNIKARQTDITSLYYVATHAISAKGSHENRVLICFFFQLTSILFKGRISDQ